MLISIIQTDLSKQSAITNHSKKKTSPTKVPLQGHDFLRKHEYIETK